MDGESCGPIGSGDNEGGTCCPIDYNDILVTSESETCSLIDYRTTEIGTCILIGLIHQSSGQDLQSDWSQQHRGWDVQSDWLQQP